MAATTLSAILERFETVLQDPSLNLERSADPFTDQAVPNALVNTTFRVLAGGLVRETSQSNFSTARVDRVTVTVQRALHFAAYDAQRELQDLLDDIERAIVADGPDQGYMVTVEKGSRKVMKKKDADVIEASIAFMCDYDFLEQV
jgi:hypothetical protein